MSTKVVKKKAMDDPELQDMFNQMVGTSEPDPKIIAPKYEDILEDAKAIVELLGRVFIYDATKDNIPQDLLTEFDKGFGDFRQFVTDATRELLDLTIAKSSMLTGSALEPVNQEPQKILRLLSALDKGYDPVVLGQKYKALKECRTINRLIIATRDLRKFVEEDKVAHKKEYHDIEFRDKMSESFIKENDSDFLVLLSSLSCMDFKQIWLHPAAVYKFRNRVVFALHILLKRGSTIVKQIMTPDIDVDKFSEMLIANIGKIRRALPRCDKAFAKIQRSVSMLKDNFGGYYKDFVVSKNPGIIVERFVTDVASSNKADAETTRQFKRIIDFYRKKMQSQPKDPRLDKIFDLLGTNINELESKSGQTYSKSGASTKSKTKKLAGVTEIPLLEQDEPADQDEPDDKDDKDDKDESEGDVLEHVMDTLEYTSEAVEDVALEVVMDEQKDEQPKK